MVKQFPQVSHLYRLRLSSWMEMCALKVFLFFSEILHTLHLKNVFSSQYSMKSSPVFLGVFGEIVEELLSAETSNGGSIDAS